MLYVFVLNATLLYFEVVFLLYSCRRFFSLHLCELSSCMLGNGHFYIPLESLLAQECNGIKSLGLTCIVKKLW